MLKQLLMSEQELLLMLKQLLMPEQELLLLGLLLMQELLQMPELELLLLRLQLMQELQKQQDQEEPHNWTLLSRLAYKHAGTWLASARILLHKVKTATFSSLVP